MFIYRTIVICFCFECSVITIRNYVSIFQDKAVSADLILNREQFEWWAFRNINPSNLSGLCGGLTGPMAIIISEETPPRKLAMALYTVHFIS